MIFKKKSTINKKKLRENTLALQRSVYTKLWAHGGDNGPPQNKKFYAQSTDDLFMPGRNFLMFSLKVPIEQ